MKYVIWNNRCIIKNNEIIIMGGGKYLKSKNNIFSNKELLWLFKELTDKEVEYHEVEFGYFDNPFVVKVDNLKINKTTIKNDENYLIIDGIKENPIILYRILSAYKILEKDNLIKIEIEKDIIDLVLLKEIIKIKASETENLFNCIPVLNIDGKEATTINYKE
jgi:hypothetical protein